MRILFLDDSKDRWKSFFEIYKETGTELVWCETSDSAIAAIETSEEPFDAIFLDHDLSEDHYMGKYDDNTGLAVVNAICKKFSDQCKETVFIVHSLNPSGNATMHLRLVKKGFRAYSIPFAWVKRVIN